MTNNDILIRLRYALDIKNTEMIEIFELGGLTLTKEEVLKILTKIDDDDFYEDYDEPQETETFIKCTNSMLESFLNGFITFKRGPQKDKNGQTVKQDRSIKNHASVNNVLLKKVKIALSLTGEEMIEIFEKAGLTVSKGELGALLRKEGHKNYKPCGDKYARNFLKGLTLKYRDDIK
ncbi:hypothetical protein JMA_28650 [Jeotgalibacillus malaysiensis]|uniref:Cytoplasmic protein n=1 Tax=Jeotgalibacillus malaysiensis TaxID=1508404 RepID=A0A0B5ATY4_9BACL|nr:hypothetical protein JMA_28650 [Jeotgalibacillus malaysiensis]